MGTNYYLEQQPPCPTCGREFDRLHIGKSSAGWCFALHVIPELGINNLDDWKAKWVGKKIFDEYGDEVSHKAMISCITDRRWGCENTKFDYLSNHAVPGPNNLVRSRVDGRHCVGHGEGTWDLIPGEFS